MWKGFLKIVLISVNNQQLEGFAHHYRLLFSGIAALSITFLLTAKEK